MKSRKKLRVTSKKWDTIPRLLHLFPSRVGMVTTCWKHRKTWHGSKDLTLNAKKAMHMESICLRLWTAFYPLNDQPTSLCVFPCRMCTRSEVCNLFLSMYPYSISTDKDVPLQSFDRWTCTPKTPYNKIFSHVFRRHWNSACRSCRNRDHKAGNDCHLRSGWYYHRSQIGWNASHRPHRGSSRRQRGIQREKRFCERNQAWQCGWRLEKWSAQTNWKFRCSGY